MSGHHWYLGGDSAVSSCVRFAERMAERLAAGKVPLAFDDRFGQRRLSSEEARQRCEKVLADVGQGVRVSVAVKRHGVSRGAFYSWCNQRRISLKVVMGRSKA